MKARACQLRTGPRFGRERVQGKAQQQSSQKSCCSQDISKADLPSEALPRLVVGEGRDTLRLGWGKFTCAARRHGHQQEAWEAQVRTTVG